MEEIREHDVIELTVDLVDIDDGLSGDNKVTLCKGERGTVMFYSDHSLYVEFLEGNGSPNTKALITILRSQAKLHWRRTD